MCKTTVQLKKLVDKRGLLSVAMLLGHKDTTTLKRWLNKEVPDLHKVGVQAVLDKEITGGN